MALASAEKHRLEKEELQQQIAALQSNSGAPVGPSAPIDSDFLSKATHTPATSTTYDGDEASEDVAAKVKSSCSWRLKSGLGPCTGAGREACDCVPPLGFYERPHTRIGSLFIQTHDA